MLNKPLQILTSSILCVFALTACGNHGNTPNSENTASEEASPAAPDLNRATINIPKINMPKINIPNIGTPGISTPNTNTPNIGTPSISTPNTNTPNIGTPDTSTPNTNTSNKVSMIQGDTVGIIDQVLSFAVVPESWLNYDKIVWQQTKGERVQLSTTNHALLRFTPSVAGEYEFRATLSLNGRTVETLTHKVTVNSTTEQVATLRGDKVAGSGGTTSVRFYTPTTLSANDWTLTQVSGKTANILISKSDTFANIELPKVSRDELLVFKAVSKNDPNLTDTVNILVKAQSTLPDKYFCSSRNAASSCISSLNALSQNYAYLRNGKYANVLADCTISYNRNTNNFCTLNTLPYLGSNTQTPTIDDIMSRVVVSHDWMAENFEKFLREYDKHDDFKRLFRSTTAIVFSDSVRPSFYWGGTGAIYINPNYLWLTPEQRDDIHEVADYRSGFSKGLNFAFEDDYEQNGKSIYNAPMSYSPEINLRETRSLQTIALPLAAVLYHELAHANDYMPNSKIKTLTRTDFTKTAYGAQPKTIISTHLATQYPLISSELKSIAQVRHGGIQATKQQLALTPEQIAQWFFKDKASDLYSFFNNREDLAMLFEEAMMLSRFGVNRHVFVVNPTNSQIVQGYKNWISHDTIKPRINFVVSQILPEVQNMVKQTLNNTKPIQVCENKTLFDYYGNNCSSNLPKADGYFIKRHNVNLVKEQMRGATPIEINEN